MRQLHNLGSMEQSVFIDKMFRKKGKDKPNLIKKQLQKQGDSYQQQARPTKDISNQKSNNCNTISMTQQCQNIFTTQPSLPALFKKIQNKNEKIFNDKNNGQAIKKKECLITKNKRKRQKSKEQIDLERTVKLKSLYSKKAQLLQRLNLLTKQTRVKTQPFEKIVHSVDTSQFTSPKLEVQKRSQVSMNSRYMNNLQSRTDSRIFSMSRSIGRPKTILPQSMTSNQNNQKVLKFIQKMHQQTLTRDINRLDKFHNLLRSRLKSQISELQTDKNNQSTHFESKIKF